MDMMLIITTSLRALITWSNPIQATTSTASKTTSNKKTKKENWSKIFAKHLIHLVEIFSVRVGDPRIVHEYPNIHPLDRHLQSGDALNKIPCEIDEHGLNPDLVVLFRDGGRDVTELIGAAADEHKVEAAAG
ncbi:hypothetical protein M5K25_005261 [Dendrobium thyrsiflorum]|uniref:Uncharacterized protein n=1 Tax=Dendrobium thyrsiflorum TaxID=117978 RepID=A0ABD0VP71_DENTH